MDPQLVGQTGQLSTGADEVFPNETLASFQGNT
jgi:hypothetical protein